MNRFRIAHAIHSGGFYGAERVICDLVRAQSGNGFRPMLISFLDPGAARNEVSDRVAALGAEVAGLVLPRGFSWKGLRAYARTLKSGGVALVHSHGYKPTLYHLVSRWLGLHRVPLIVTAHGYPKGSGGLKASLYRLLDILLLGTADSVVAVSGEMRAYLSARNPVIKPLTIPNGMADIRVAGSHPLLRHLNGDGGVPVIGSAGRLVPMKNHALLIRAYAAVRARHPCRLVILGDGPLREELAALWRALVPGEEPRLLPFQSDVFEWVADMDVFSLPSNDGEGLPMALLEAGLLRRAVACSRSGGIPEVVRDGENGRLFGLGDLDGLTGALGDLLADAGKRARYGEALRSEVLARHDIQTTHQRYAEAYARILANR